MVRLLNFLRQRHLAFDPPDCFDAGKAVSFLEPGKLSVPVRGNHDDDVDACVDTGFKEEWYFVEDDCMRFARGDQPNHSLLLSSDTGMNDAFKLSAFRPIAENDARKGLSIEGTVRLDDGSTECFHDLPPGRFSRLYDIPGQLVCIDDDRTALLEHRGDGAFAAGDATCEADHNHGCGA